MSRFALCAAACALACLACVVGLAGCSDDGGGPTIDAATDAPTDAPVDAALDAPTGPLTLTSPALTEGGRFAVDYTCNGANRSLPLAWVNTPPGTKSLAVIMTDTTVNLIHWAIYDIPAPRVGLPEDVDKVYAPSDVPGAHQAKSFNAQVTGYLGPCPPQQHGYAIVLYALDVASLPADEATSRIEVKAMAEMHDLASAMLTGVYQQP